MTSYLSGLGLLLFFFLPRDVQAPRAWWGYTTGKESVQGNMSGFFFFFFKSFCTTRSLGIRCLGLLQVTVQLQWQPVVRERISSCSVVLHVLSPGLVTVAMLLGLPWQPVVR